MTTTREKETTGEKLSRQLIQSTRTANRQELEVLYREYVCSDITEDAIKMMRDGELKRYTSLGMFLQYKPKYTHNRRIITAVCNAVGVSQTALYVWIKEMKERR